MPPGTWLRPNDAVDGLFYGFWANTTCLKVWAYCSFDKPSLKNFWLELRRYQPESMAELHRAAKDVGETIPGKMLRDNAQNVHKLAKACIETSSGHFEHFFLLS